MSLPIAQSVDDPTRGFHTAAMGAIHVTVTLSWPEAQRPFEALFLVDTGATDSMAPRSALLAAGFHPAGRMAYELANGQPVEYDFTLSTISFMVRLPRVASSLVPTALSRFSE